MQSSQFEDVKLIKDIPSDYSKDNFVSKVVSNTSNYLIPPTISYTSRNRDTPSEYPISEKVFKIKSQPIENFCAGARKNVHNNNNNINSKLNNFHQDCDVQSIINERRPLKLKVRVPELLDPSRNESFLSVENRCDNIPTDDTSRNYSLNFNNDFSATDFY